MKANFGKRVLSLVLCVVMLASCWVFTAPSASAATWYAGNSSVKNSSTTAYTGTSTLTSNRTGKYRVRLLVKEITQFDEAIHDKPSGLFNSKDFPYEPGFAFGPNDSDSQRNLNGTSTADDLGKNEVSRDSSLTQHKYWCEYAKISYKTMNGSSSGADGAVWFNLGDQDDYGRTDGVSGGGYNWGYFPSDDGVVIDGFPTDFTTRYYNTKAIAGKKEYYHVWLQVAKWTGTNTWNWDDYGGTCTKGLTPVISTASIDDKYCKGIADVGCNMNSSSKVKELKASQTVDASKFPYATIGTATANSTTAKTTAPTVNFTTTSSTAKVESITLPSTSGTTYSSRVYYTDPYDQYGAVMASTIQLNYTQSGKKSYFTQDGTTTGFAYGANITGNTDTQQLRAKVTWPSASNAATELSTYSNELTVNDASYTVSFKSEDGSATYTTDPSSFQYGHTPEYNGTTPTKTDTANNPQVYIYTHDGWSSTANGTKLTSLPAVTGDSNKTFYAHFSQSLKDYTVKFVNNENTEISSDVYHIGDTLTEPDSSLIPDTYQSIDKVYTHTGWVGTNGEVYDGTCQGAITYKPVYSDVARQYTVTFKKEDGTVIKSQDLDYGTIPSSVEGLVPDLIDKDPDNTNHYTSSWSTSVDTAITGDTEFKIVYTGTPHTLGEATTKTAATCTETGIDVQTCSVCNHEVETVTPINPNNHDWGQAKYQKPTDNTGGYMYYQCSRCENFCPAAINEGAYVPNPGEDYENVVEEASSVEAKTDKVPAPFFNDNNGSAQFYDNVNYSERPASFRYDSSSNLQTMRFAGSVKVPEGVSWEVGSKEDNVVIDFGFVYTQTKYICDCVDGKYQVVQTTDDVFNDDNEKIGEYSYLEYPTADPSRLVYDFNTDEPLTDKADIGKEGYKIYKMSVVNPGSGVTRPADGYSHHDIGSAGSESHYLSFNLVISVKQSNWEKEYSARPYIRYKYHGNVYTVYDGGASNFDANLKYSHRSVMELADDIICYDPFDEEAVLPSFVNSYRNTYKVNPSYSTYLAWVGYLRNDKDFAQNKFYNLNQLDEDEQAALIDIKFYSIGWMTTFDVDYFLDPDQSLQDGNYKGEDWYNLVLSSI